MIRIQCWRRKLDNRIIVRHPNGYIYIAATPTECTIFLSGYHGIAAPEVYKSSIMYAEEKDLVETQDLIDLEWIHPHLLKSIKEQIKNYLK